MQVLEDSGNSISLRQSLVFAGIRLSYPDFNILATWLGISVPAYRKQNFRSTALIREIYKCLPNSWSSMNFSTLRQWEDSILPTLNQTEQENLAELLSKSPDMREQLITVFANYHTHPCSPYTRARVSSNLIASVQRIAQKKTQEALSLSLSDMSLDKLSSLRLRFGLAKN